jgi:hypothetical protein
MANRQQFKQSREDGLKEALSPLQNEKTTPQIQVYYPQRSGS